MNDFYSSTKIFSTVTKLQRCHQEHFGGSQKACTVLSDNKILCSLVFLDSYPSSGHVISRTWPIKVPLIDISGYTEKFACLRCQQGCKNKKLVIKNFQIFCKCHWTPFLVVVWTGPMSKLDLYCFFNFLNYKWLAISSHELLLHCKSFLPLKVS